MTRAIRFGDLPLTHPGRRLLTGYTPSFAVQADPRLSYSLFIPEDLRDDEPPLQLWVFMHGTGRRTGLYLDHFAELARAQRAAVLTPLFPAGLDGPDDINNYKLIECAGVRFDEILIDIVAEVSHRWNVEGSRFFLHGFSGGGQFANRFAMMHPDRLGAVSIGAPGQITLPRADLLWPDGVADLADRFGTEFVAEELARVPMQVVVGALDTDAYDLAYISPDGASLNRLTKASLLAEAFEAVGAPVRLDVVEAVAHDGAGVLDIVTDFLRSQTGETAFSPSTRKESRNSQ